LMLCLASAGVGDFQYGHKIFKVYCVRFYKVNGVSA
jgi:hypothetical protein